MAPRHAVLHHLIPAEVGACVENQTFAANGNAEQRTTRGWMVRRKADTWTAFSNGSTTWIQGPYGLGRRLNTERFGFEQRPPGDRVLAVIRDVPTTDWLALLGSFPRRPTGQQPTPPPSLCRLPTRAHVASYRLDVVRHHKRSYTTSQGGARPPPAHDGAGRSPTRRVGARHTRFVMQQLASQARSEVPPR